jgi:outer membrane protein OmpA-like peptidoglycan-associated protein
MEFIMQINRSFLLALIAVAALSGCSTTTPPQSTLLSEAHNHYNAARSNPEVANLAALELKDAGDTLDKADTALSTGQSLSAVDHLAYIANQKVSIAQETARQKAAELAVTNAAAKRNEIRLQARTDEADQAKQQAAMANEVAGQQAADLATAGVNAQRDQALIAKQQQELKDLNARKTERGTVITLGDVLFRTDSAQLQSGGVRNVQKLADFLNQSTRTNVLIEGHTDNTGSNSHNQILSEQRANVVKMALIDMGVSSDRISTRGYGEQYPVASNDTAANRQLNRRVEIILSDDSGKIAPR